MKLGSIFLLISLAAPLSGATIPAEIRTIVERGTSVALGSGQSEPLYSIVPLFWFYEQRQFEPAWSGRTGDLLRALDGLAYDGMRPADYHRDEIIALLRRHREAPSAEVAAAADVLMTDAWLTAAQHLLAGRIDPGSIGADWFISRPERDFVPLLREALAAGDVEAPLRAARPSHPGYDRLRIALAQLRSIESAGGWPRIETVPPKGTSGPEAKRLRRLLELTGDLPPVSSGGDRHDDAVVRALRRFQLRHGLEPDGVIGPRTLEALNVPARVRIEQIVANLERWRWLPLDLGERHLLVNLADFRLSVVDGSREVMSMRVVAGRSYRRTPVLSSTMSQVVFNPSWSVPPIIAATDILEKAKKDPSYLSRNRIRVFSGGKEHDPSSIRWSKFSESNFPFHLRQDPGPQNALGRLKFVFPNRFNVYLHDSPERDLFRRDQRDFSSGCVRVERPEDLAAWLLEGRMSREAIRKAIAGGRETSIGVSKPVPIHLLYWTAWVDAEGLLHFRPDVYDRDTRLIRELLLPAPDRR